MTIGSYLQPFGRFCGHLIYFMVIWHIFSRIGMLYKEKSGNPGYYLHDHFVATLAVHASESSRCFLLCCLDGGGNGLVT
jgi:hypothetical protein